MTPHSHMAPDGTTVEHSHSSHNDAGHRHHADSQYGKLGPMMNDEIDADGVVSSPLQDVIDGNEDTELNSVVLAAGIWAPRSNLVRSRGGNDCAEWRATADNPTGELFGHFSRFNDWYEVSSLYEGHFVEQVLPGAFTDTIKNDRQQMKVLYDHGQDGYLGNKPLGTITTLREDEDGPYYEAKLYNTDYNRECMVPVLSGQMLNGETTGQSGFGASFRFEVQDDKWNRSPKPTKRNPDGLPERSISRAKVFEFGPVTFPASSGASAGARSLSDAFLKRIAADPGFLGDFLERTSARVASRVLESIPEELRAIAPPPRDLSSQQRMRRMARAILGTAA